jgi:hypothetical protein
MMEQTYIATSITVYKDITSEDLVPGDVIEIPRRGCFMQCDAGNCKKLKWHEIFLMTWAHKHQTIVTSFENFQHRT